jgi:hypothetical protein
MKKVVTTLTLSMGMVAGSMLAQNETDALRYSQLSFGGTARSESMAGSFGALGADFSTLSSNPAGIGVYRKGEISLTPGFMYQSTTSTYQGTSADDQRVAGTWNNAGLVFVGNLDREGNKNGWKFVQFGIGMNRLANYNSQVSTSGVSGGSIMDKFRYDADGLTPANLDAFGSALAFNTYLLDTVRGSGGTSYFEALNNGDRVNHQQTVQSSGSYNEMDLTLGGNYNNKLFLGATFGIPYVNYNQNTSYMETAMPGNTSDFSQMSYTQSLSTSGSGFNFKIGAIYKPVEFLRVGLAFHTKTWLSLHDSWNASMTSNFTNGDAYQASSGPGDYDYNITTPGRIIASVAGILGQSGVINVDYETVDYSQAHLSSKDAGAFDDANAAAKANFTRASIVRVGGEYRLKPLTLRLGFAWYQSPYANAGNDDARTSFTGGVGFRHKRFFLDLAYVLTLSNSKYYMYDATFMPEGPATNATSVSTYLATVGFKFR